MNPSNKIDIDNVFQDVLKLVKGGMNIEIACKKLHVSTTTLYRRMSKNQKNELMFYKVSNSKYDYMGLHSNDVIISEI